MVEIAPFRGLIYNQRKIKDLSLVVTPPYDVISPLEQEKYYQKHPNNVIRLILGKIEPGDDEKDNRYIRATKFFKNWIEEEFLARDKSPALYLYLQEFVSGKKRKARMALTALMKLEDYKSKSIMPHEKTFTGPKRDRLNLLRTCKANFCSIFLLYSDPEQVINKILYDSARKKPLIEFVDDSGIKHKLWRMSDKNKIKKIKKEMQSKVIFIADGHHRYETALKFRDIKRADCKNFSGREEFNYTMVSLVSMEDPGLEILPFHRLVKGLKNLDRKKLLQQLAKFFDLTELNFSGAKGEDERRKELLRLMAKKGKDNHAFGLFLGDNKFYLLILKDAKITGEVDRSRKSLLWKKLDVNILNNLIFKEILGVEEKIVLRQKNIEYIVDSEQAIEMVKNKKYDILFFLNPPKIREISCLVCTREKMPQKTTYFYPKLITGLVMNKISISQKVEEV